MIAVDTSSFIAFLQGDEGEDVAQVEWALQQKLVAVPPVVLVELLSDPNLDDRLITVLSELPLMDNVDGYWQRAGRLRSRLISRGRRARLADSMIAQSCIDHRTALVTRDRDFQSFTSVSNLNLL